MVPLYHIVPLKFKAFTEFIQLDQEDADAAIAFVQTSAQLLSAGANAMAVDAQGAVEVASAPRPRTSLGGSQVMSVASDGRMHVEM